MTVRWKPLLVLSGVFAAIAVIGVIAMAFAIAPRGAAEILPKARAEWAAKRYAEAVIRYKQALQKDGKNPAIHEELAGLYADWGAHAPPEKQAELRASQFASLVDAANHGKTRLEPRKTLLSAAMAQDEVPESLHWARETLVLEPGNADAHYVLASAALDDRSANAPENHLPIIPEVKRHLKALEDAKAPPVRIAWIKARLAQVAGDAPGCASVLETARTLSLPAEADAEDRMALLRLRALDVEMTPDTNQLAGRVKLLQDEAHALVARPGVAPNRVMRLNLLLGSTQKALSQTAAKAEPAAKAGVTALIDSIDADIETIFRQALAALEKTDMHVYLTYADHLRYRGKRDRCLEVVDRGLKSPLAELAASSEVVMSLHAVAVEAALADGKDKSRYEKAAPHIKELIGASRQRSQGFGHLFQGAIELEQSGVVGVPAEEGGEAPRAQPKLRMSALNHLKIAAAQLPNVVEAQARYGVALILSQEPALGRQYLQAAMRQGEAEPQYQVWAAWSMVQAGYPEEAEPVVTHLQAEMSRGRVPRELEGTLHLLAAEILQARRSPGDLKNAQGEYERSFSGKIPPAGIQLRLAQIDIQLGQGERALRRIDELRARGQGGPAAEHLAVLTLREMGKPKEALDALSAARKTYPASEELVGLEAALLLNEEKPKEADRVLSAFLEREPNNVGIVLMRAQILTDLLDNAKEARTLLTGVADHSENSAPLVQLALLDLKQQDYNAVSATIAKVRARWKEAAAADLLDAQLSLEQGNLSDASAHFDAALKKDPGNKMVQFWKAQIDSRLGSSGDAAQAFEAIARDGTTKQLDSGVSLAAAAKSALANMALQQHDLDGAIRRFEGLRSGGGSSNGIARSDRWQLVAAYAAKGQWPSARKEIASLLNDPKSPPTNDERARAADYYRRNKDDASAVAQLDYVLRVNPAQPSAVVSRAHMLWESKKTAEAIALVRKAIATPGKGTPPAVFFLVLAALENDTKPATEAAGRALAALDEGLAARPDSAELFQAKYKLLSVTRGNAAAVAYVESEAKSDPKGNRLRVLAEVYRDQKDYPKAETAFRELVSKNPKEPRLAASLVRVVAVQAARAGEANDRDRERTLNESAGALIKEYRARFPNEMIFLQEDCDLAFRRGDITRATSITEEIDRLAKNNSPVGPLLRARLCAAQGRTRDVADAYTEALRRNPSQADVRLLLGRTRLRLGENDEAIRQAKLVLDGDADRAEAILLEARALAQPSATPTDTAARRSEAVDLLKAAVKRHPKFSAAYHLVAEIQMMSGRRADAVETLKGALEAEPNDAAGLALLVELLAGPASPGGQPDAANLARARDLSDKAAARDKTGEFLLASAVGYHKAGQYELARDQAEKAAGKLDAPAVHLNYGDILLSLAESRSGEEAAPLFKQAVSEYDKVLKVQAISVEAVNNKAWILYRYLGESRKALEVAQGLLARVDPSTLPGEFFDTLGAIQEAVGQPRDAEESYNKGLRKSPENPALNFHMARLVNTDPRRAAKARVYLEKAEAGRSRMSPAMASEVAALKGKVGAN